ncbi:unnamed protein product [Phytomonas sp. Hart1]|nr:unnamed protein product [Phytomonas sp. Hart1]|eukprot:CCW66441.1 unnamed protein product [Phytomonas sp. isolate Hart1]
MDSMVNDISNQHCDFTLYAGDWERHKFTEDLDADVLFTDMKNSFSAIKTLNLPPDKSFIGALGNEDMTPNYNFDVFKTKHDHLIERVSIMNNSLLSPEEANEMVKCAFFARHLETVTFISLHSLIWSTTLKPRLADNVTDPCNQFAFLEKELELAKKNGKKVIIIAHIPPIMDTYVVILNGKFTNSSNDMLWKESYYKKYIKLISAYKDTISVQIFGHLHLFYFLCFPEIVTPTFVLPAITPLSGNVPSYLLATFSDSWEITDLNQRTLIGNKWHNTVNVKGVFGSVDGLYNLNKTRERIKDFYTDDRAWLDYLQLHNGGEATNRVFREIKPSSFSRAVTVCSSLSGNYDTIKGCVSELMAKKPLTCHNTNLKTFLLIFLPIASGIIITCLIILIICVARRHSTQKIIKDTDIPDMIVEGHATGVHSEYLDETNLQPNADFNLKRFDERA